MRGRRTIAAAALACAAVLASACSDDTSRSTDPDRTPATSDAPTGDASPADPTPTATDQHSVAPATGVLLSLRHAEVRTPEGWRIGSVADREGVGAGQLDGTGHIRLADRAFDYEVTVAQLRESSLNTQNLARPPEPRPNTTLDGVEVYHLAGLTDGGRWVEEFGAPYEDAIVRVTIELDADLTPVERRETVASILASFRWK